ncbi:MAG: hypothetical protein R3A48_26705 [Polyangiales bacterium]
MRALGVAALALLSGCVLDFEELLTRPRDAGGRLDAPSLDAQPLDAGDVPKAEDRADLPDAVVVDDRPATDAPLPLDAGPCGSGAGVELRLAHMASRFGAMTLCMRHGAGGYTAVRDPRWPAAGIAEAQISARFETNAVVTEQNESWQFAVIPVGSSCAEVTAQSPGAASITAQLDPGDRITLLFSSELSSQGRLVGVLGLLQDKVCTACPDNSYDIRAVHAAFGASRARLEFAIDYVTPDGEPSLVNVFFAQNVGYGSTSPTGDRGFDCDSAWYLGAMLPPSSLVGLSAFEVGGDAVASSERFHLKGSRLAATRLATVFFRGDWVDRWEEPEFVLCYEGAQDAGLTVCDRIPATAVRHADAGAPDARDAPPTDAPPDAPTPMDAGADASLEFDAAADDDVQGDVAAGG